MSDLIGQEFGAYRILEQIGAGGMATVYKAYHAVMDRHVAVKVLPEQMGLKAEFRKRFDREAKVIARLEHAHILPVHDYGQAGNRLYLVMRYIEAGTLKDRMDAGLMDLTEVNRIMHQVGGALDHPAAAAGGAEASALARKGDEALEAAVAAPNPCKPVR